MIRDIIICQTSIKLIFEISIVVMGQISVSKYQTNKLITWCNCLLFWSYGFNYLPPWKNVIPHKFPRFINTFIQDVLEIINTQANLLMNLLSVLKSRKVLNITFVLITVVMSYTSDIDNQWAGLPQITNKSEIICWYAYMCTPIISSQSVFKQLCV